MTMRLQHQAHVLFVLVSIAAASSSSSASTPSASDGVQSHYYPPPPPPNRGPQEAAGRRTEYFEQQEHPTINQQQHRTQHTPIHYPFRREASSTSSRAIDEDDIIPRTLDAWTRRSNSGTATQDETHIPVQLSPRQDAITNYMITRKGAMTIRSSCVLVGYVLGAVVGQSLFSNAKMIGTVMATLFFILSFFRSSYGELVRALGLALILAMKQTSAIRRMYPTWPYVKASLGLQKRTPFPPCANPWTYRPMENSDDPDFSMLYTMIAMTLVGTTIGGTLPLIPTWIGGTLGSVTFAAATTLQDARGDVCRTMGARLVALAHVFVDVNAELKLLSKTMVVTSKIVDKIFILDRKHKIKDKVVAGATLLYERVSGMAKQVQKDIMNDRGTNRNDGDRTNNEQGPEKMTQDDYYARQRDEGRRNYDGSTRDIPPDPRAYFRQQHDDH